MRDSFTKKTIDILAKRVGYLCSNPLCRKPTSGPHSEKNKATLTGVAAHITAASVGGPRYNPTLDEEQRKNIDNGIWLCGNCAALIDKDPNKFPVEIIKEWKISAEKESNISLKQHHYSNLPTVSHIRPYVDAELKLTGRSKNNRRLSNKTKELYGDKAILESQVIWHFEVYWRYKFILVNNSSVGLYNLKLISNKQNIGLTILEKLDRINNLPPYHEISLKCESLYTLEGIGRDAIDLMHKPHSPHINDLKYLVEYSGDNKTKYYTELSFRNGQMESTHIDVKPENYT